MANLGNPNSPYLLDLMVYTQTVQHVELYRIAIVQSQIKFDTTQLNIKNFPTNSLSWLWWLAC